MKKKICFLMIFVLLMSLLSACSSTKTDQTSKSQTSMPEKKTITVTDLTGRKVEIKCPPQRVVLLEYGGTDAEILKALNAEKSIIAIDEQSKKDLNWPSFITKVSSVGVSADPNIEQITSLKPDLVIAWSLKPEVMTKLQNSGIPVILGYAMGSSKLLDTITSFGQIFEQGKRANEFLDYINSQFNAVNERTKSLTEERKPKIYVEGSTAWMGFPFTPDRLEPKMVETAGGSYVLKDKNISGHTISPEWVTQENPDIIIKIVRGSNLIGFDVTNTDKLKAIRDEICARPGLKETNAVKNGRVYIMDESLLRAKGAAGIWYLAKLFHPDLFKDVDTTAKFNEFLNKFFDAKLKGIWIYPET
jgi:iron complex transport system substrate-binding protein